MKTYNNYSIKRNYTGLVLSIIPLFASLTAAVDSDYPPLLDENSDISRAYGTGTSAHNSGALVDDLLSLTSVQKTTSALSEITGTLPKAFSSRGILLDYVLKNRPTNGTLNFQTGQYTYTYIRNINFFGEDLFSFTLTSGTSTANVIVVVSADNNPVPVNHAPVIKDEFIIGKEDTIINGTLLASNADGDKLTYKIASGPTHGTVNLDPANGKYTDTTNNPNFSGDDSFAYQAYDGKGGISNIATITVKVNPITGCEAFKKAFVQPKWGFWHCWSVLKSCWSSCCCNWW
ncbi:MAG: Ig-like domain-containing protein [Alphaproteobacteria bacterium]